MLSDEKAEAIRKGLAAGWRGPILLRWLEQLFEDREERRQESANAGRPQTPEGVLGVLELELGRPLLSSTSEAVLQARLLGNVLVVGPLDHPELALVDLEGLPRLAEDDFARLEERNRSS